MIYFLYKVEGVFDMINLFLLEVVSNKWLFVFKVIVFAIACGSVLISFICLLYIAIFRSFYKEWYNKYRKSRINLKKVDIYREIPCDDDIFEAFFLAEIYELGIKRKNFLGALLLKWIKEGQIKVVKTSKQGLFKEKEVIAFDLSKDLAVDYTLEVEMYDMLREASQDNILKPWKLIKWCRKNYYKYTGWFDNIMFYYGICYEENGLIEDRIVSKKKKRKVCSLDLHNKAVKLAGLKKFLIEFSKMNDKGVIDVKLWEDYLIYAQIFGIADKVSKELKRIYPSIVADIDSLYSNDTIRCIKCIGSSSYNFSRTLDKGSEVSQGHSSGGGGHSFGGGGGGSFGGGSGGGTR